MSTAGQLTAEHAFAAHLRVRGIPVPEQVRLAGGRVVHQTRFVYEVQELAAGVDAYADAVSWPTYRGGGHAWSSGAALATLHQAAASFAGAERAPGVLLGSSAMVLDPDPAGQLKRMMATRPGLVPSRRSDGRRTSRRAARDPAGGAVLPTAAPAMGHGDWHPSNLAAAARSAGRRVVAATGGRRVWCRT